MMRWAGRVTRIGRKGMHIGYWWESQKERAHWEDQDVGWRIILKWIFDGLRWYGLDLTGSKYGPVQGSCEHGNKLSDSIKCREVLE
jgi:hypothetical protein